MSIIDSATADPTAYASSLSFLFRDRGFSTCDGNGIQFEYGTEFIQAASATSSPLPTDTVITTTSPSPASNNSSQSPTISSAAENVSPGLMTRDKAAIGVVVPVVAIISFALGMIFYLRRRRKRSQSDKGKNVSEETQPYLQQKAELEAEEKRRLELEAVEVRYEMDGGDDRKEVPAPESDGRNEIDTITRPPMPSLRERQELRGEDCSRELEAP